MDLNTIKNLREEFGKQLDTAIAQEIKQRELGEAELAALAEVLPELIIPQLSASDEKKALKIKDDLDNKVEALAELTAQISRVAADYKRQSVELKGLLMGKSHNIKDNYSGDRLRSMLSILGRIIETEVYNGVLGFGSLPTKDYIKGRIDKYNGI